jgi:hypothetical protein
VIYALAWKEYRQQRLVWLALAVLAIPIVWGAGQLLSLLPRTSEEDLPLAALAALGMAGTYGLVCGALLLAGERETRTQGFLDALPRRRISLWAVKLLAGIVLALAQAVLLTVLVSILGIAAERWPPGEWFLLLSAVGLEAMAYGMLGSAVCRNVLAAAGLGAVLNALSWFGCGPVRWPPDGVVLAARTAWAVAALAASALLYCRTDLERWPAFSRTGGRLGKALRLPPARALAWLCWRQGRLTAVVLGVIGLGVGLALPFAAPVIWPVFSLILGLVCGTAVFAGEQSSESYRFLGDQRLGAGWVWSGKVVFWLAVGCGAIVLAILGAALHTQVQIIAGPQTSLQHFFERTGTPKGLLTQIFHDSQLVQRIGPFTFTALWPAYGFCIGLLTAMMIRRTIVAALVALFLTVAGVTLWLPSFFRGGLAAWQAFVIPALFLLASRAAAWAWATNRLSEKRAAVSFAGWLLLAAAWLSACLWYRVHQIPDPGEPFDVKAFKASIPPPEKNEAGRLIRQAAKDFDEWEKRVTQKLGPPKPRPQPPAAGRQDRTTYAELVDQAVEEGWRKNEGDLRRWMDEVFSGAWAGRLRKLPTLPLGVIEDPRNRDITSSDVVLPQVSTMGRLLIARAGQLQAQGDYARALEDIVLVLALSRNLRTPGSMMGLLIGWALESTALEGLDRWLRELGPNAQLLEKALDELNRHEARCPPAAESIKSEYLMVLNSLKSASTWESFNSFGNPEKWLARLESLLSMLSWQVPWEKERMLRIVRAQFTKDLEVVATPYWEIYSPGANGGDPQPTDHFDWLRPRSQWHALIKGSGLEFFFPRLPHSQVLRLCRLRALRLRIALALYEINNGHPAKQLADLAPRYLAKVPVDPYNGQPFHYRISKGERLQWTVPPIGATPKYRRVESGQGIIWSVGPSLRDHGGKIQLLDSPDLAIAGAPGFGDYIFLVPRWIKTKTGWRFAE